VRTEDIEAISPGTTFILHGRKMHSPLKEIVESYHAGLSVADASAPPAAWYTDRRLFELERQTVFASNWHFAARAEQLNERGQYVTCDLAGEPILVVRGNDDILRGFFNLCRHKGAAIMMEGHGRARTLRCPYHGWTYTVEGELKGTPDFAGVQNFDPSANGLIAVQTARWEDWVFVRVEPDGPSLPDFLGAGLTQRIGSLGLGKFRWAARRHYMLNCNWKVFVDNYLDGGYHVPHLHGELNSVLDYAEYTIETGERSCLQSSPILNAPSNSPTAAVRKGHRALYFWLYPNFMINWYEGVMDTNLVIPRGIDRTEVVFDFYFAGVSAEAQAQHLASMAVSEQIQREDVAICESVQRGLSSRAYKPGRLSVRREAGEHLFHSLLYADLQRGLDRH
jgi:choline monooxygenase